MCAQQMVKQRFEYVMVEVGGQPREVLCCGCVHVSRVTPRIIPAVAALAEMRGFLLTYETKLSYFCSSSKLPMITSLWETRCKVLGTALAEVVWTYNFVF